MKREREGERERRRERKREKKVVREPHNRSAAEV